MSYQYAGFWIRFWATIIDSILWVVVMTPIVYIFGLDADLANAQLIYSSTDIVSNLGLAIFSVVCWLKFAGTPGKRLLKLKVLDAETGQHISLKQGVLRYLMYIPSMLVFFLGLIWVGFDAKKQGWHDKVAKTYVVKEIN